MDQSVPIDMKPPAEAGGRGFECVADSTN
jgi:hypothetical protein